MGLLEGPNTDRDGDGGRTAPDGRPSEQRASVHLPVYTRPVCINVSVG